VSPLLKLLSSWLALNLPRLRFDRFRELGHLRTEILKREVEIPMLRITGVERFSVREW
jgi:hypothetical protein